MSEQEQTKKKGLIKKISEKFKGERPDELVMETLTELKDIVSSMKNVFEEFEEGYEEQLEEERTAWQKMQTKLPSFLQSSQTKSEMHRMERIKSNKSTLAELEDNFNKLEMVLTSSSATMESISEAYINTAIPAHSRNDDAIMELEKRMEMISENMSASLGDINAQISLIKSALDNMAGQLDEHGVVLDGIDSKVNVLDEKMDKAQNMLEKISKKLTGNRIILLVIAGTATALIAQKFLVA
ncbi:MAG: hypothetical protein INQ03_00300 [Candidatus Heimdallarchaeota archaeon]|nr:hypothetical protein [Candidatus Heimdallarchaeota archaeon]